MKTNTCLFSAIGNLFRIFTILLLGVLPSVAQQSPNAVALGEYANLHPLNFYTGQAVTSVPITTISAKGVSVPVALSYNAGAMRVEAIASNVGMGWALNAGGVITRAVMGIPDDYVYGSWLGYLSGTIPTSVNNFSLTASESDTRNALDYYRDNYMDTEPDVFFFNFNGRTGKFVFNKDKEAKIISGDQKLLISYNRNSTSQFIDKFEVTDEAGNKYFFEAYEYTATTTYTHTDFPTGTNSTSTSNTGLTHYSSWYLTKILTPSFEEILFNYADEEQTFRTGNSQQALSCTDGSCTNYYENGNYKGYLMRNYSLVVVNAKRLTSISGPVNEVSFVASTTPRSDLPGSHRIEKIEIRNKLNNGVTGSVLAKTFLLSYFVTNTGTSPSVQENYRLFLSGITETAYNSTQSTLNPYVFTYNLASNSELPATVSCAVDLWGYWNGKSNAHLIPKLYIYGTLDGYERYSPIQITSLGSPSHTMDGADRSSDINYAIKGTLKQIDYPNGGSTEFEYELHAFRLYNMNFSGGGIRIKKVITKDNVNTANNLVREIKYEDFSDNTKSSGRIVALPRVAYNTSERIYTGDGMTCGDWNYYYKNVTRMSSSMISFGTSQGSDVVYKQVREILGNNGKTDYYFSVPATYTRYSDCLGSGCDCEITEEGYCDGLHTSPATMYVRDDLDGINCQTNCPRNPVWLDCAGFSSDSYTYPFAPLPDYDWNRGLLLKRKDFDQNNKLLKELVNTYTLLETETTHKVYGIKQVYANNWGVQLPLVFFSKYHYLTGYQKVLSSASETLYDQDPNYSNAITSTTSYLYENTALLVPTKVNTVNSDGVEVIKKVKYNSQYDVTTVSGTEATALKAMADRHILNVPVEEVKYTKLPGESEKVIEASLNTFRLQNMPGTSNTLIVPHESFYLPLSAPLSSFTFSAVNVSNHQFWKNSTYIRSGKYDLYDGNGNLLQFTPENGASVSYKYTYGVSRFNYILPQVRVAELGNAANSDEEVGNESGYAGFESACDEGVVNMGVPLEDYWELYQTDADNTQAHTGSYSRKVDAAVSGTVNTLSRYFKPVNQCQKFVFSVWVKTESGFGTDKGVLKMEVYQNDKTTIISAQANVEKKFSALAEWTLIEGVVDLSPFCNSNTNMHIKCYMKSEDNAKSFYVDDIIFRPYNAVFSYHTLHPVFGAATSKTDAHNLSAHVEYDAFGRPEWTRDFKGNRLSHTIYSQQNPSVSGDFSYVQTDRFLQANQSATYSLPSHGNIISGRNYTDGLGRPLQSIALYASPTYNDIISPVVYDALGRQPRTYLPFAASDNNNGGAYRSNALTQQTAFYREAQRIGRAVNPWYDHRIERSNLSRLLEKSAPGYDFRMENGHTLLFQYRTNTCDDQVLHWIYNASTQRWEATEVYGAGTLLVEETRDENFHWILTFKDKSGRHICTYTQRTAAPAANATSFKNQHPLFDYNVYNVTYNIYDQLGNLIITVSPQGMLAMNSAGFNLTASMITNHTTTYTYDNKGRVIVKDAGKESEAEYVYDKMGRALLNRDKHMPAREWKFVKHDVLGREVLSGIFEAGVNDTRATLQVGADEADYMYEIRSNTNFSQNQGYSNRAFPTHQHAKLLSVSYYDDYDFDLDGDQDEVSVPSSSTGVRTSNLLTGSKLRNISYDNSINSTWYLSTVFYDDYGRVTTARSENHTGGTQEVVNTYSFSGNLTQSVLSHKRTSSSSTVTVTHTFTYDHMLRPLKTTHQVNNQNAVILSSAQYNELGQLYEKNLHSTNNGSSYLQSVDFAYDARGWLTHINKADLSNDNGGFNWNNYATINSIGAHAGLQVYSFGSSGVTNGEFAEISNAAAANVSKAVRQYMFNNGGPIDFDNPVYISDEMSEKAIIWLENQFSNRYDFERALRVSLPCGVTEYSDNYTNDPDTYNDALYAAYPNRTVLKYKLRTRLINAFVNIINSQSLDRTSANSAAASTVNTFFTDVVNALLGSTYSVSTSVYQLPAENTTYSDCYFAESFDYYNTSSIGTMMSNQIMLHLLNGQFDPSTMETHLAGVMPQSLDPYGDLSDAYVDPEYNDFPYRTLVRYILRNMLKAGLDAYILGANIPRCASTNNIADGVISEFKTTFFASNNIPTSTYRLTCPTSSQNSYYLYTGSQFADDLATAMLNQLNTLGTGTFTYTQVNDKITAAVTAYNPSSCNFNSWFTVPVETFHLKVPVSSAYSSEAIAAISMEAAHHTLAALERDGYDEAHFATATFQGIHLAQAQSDPEYAYRPNATKLLHELAGSVQSALTALGNNATAASFRSNINSAVNGLVAYAFTSPLTGGKLIFNDDANDLFGMELKYNQAASPGKKQFNGNISSMHWKISGSGQMLHNYVFSYDQLNQLTGAQYYALDNAASQTATGNYNEQLTYDRNGNIKTLKRWGLLSGSSTYGLVDDLLYKYNDNDRGNKLLVVDDIVTATTVMGNDFTESSTYANGYAGLTETTEQNLSLHEYLYKPDGSLEQDKNKGITLVNYNYLNLPAEITFAGGGKIRFLYAADGVKLSQTVIPATGTTITTDYVDGFVYETPSNTNVTVLKFFNHAQGRVVLNSSTYEYEYTLTDHLGNARVSFKDNNGSAQIIQHNAYYPFGLSINDAVMHYVNGQENLFTYTGKELITAEGLEWYDYGWRMYDAQLGRWHCPDPEDVHWSTYLAMANNPITVIDPDGREPISTIAIITISVLQAIEKESQKSNPNYLEAGIIGAIKGTVSVLSAPTDQLIFSMISDQLPAVNIPINEKISVTIRPSFGFSTTGIMGMGANVSVNHTEGDMTYTTSFTARFGSNTKLTETRTGIGATYHSSSDGDFSFNVLHFGVKDPQNTWTARWRKGDWTLGVTEDYGFGDEYRTIAAEVGHKDLIVGTSLYTNKPNRDLKRDEKFVSRIAGRNKKYTYADGKRVYSNFYFGIKDGNHVFRAGIESPWIQDIIQNGFHRILSNTSYFRTEYNDPTLPYFHYGTYDPMSIY
ncbi:MAG: DUF6443 domain-containing protein [Bacteroidia bacterium]